MPTAITLSPSLESRAIEGSGRRSGSATAAASRVEHRDGRGLGPAGASQSLVTSSPPSRTTNELCGRSTGSRCEARTSRSGLEPVRPAPEDHVQVAVRVGGDPARPERPAGQPRRRRGHRERLRVEALDPGLDRRRLGPRERDVVAERVELARARGATSASVAKASWTARDLEPLARAAIPRPGIARDRPQRRGPPSSQVHGCGQ